MPATITVVCPECNKSIQAPADFAGKKVRCKECGHIFHANPAPPRGAVARAPVGKAAGRPTAASKPPVAPLVAGSDEDEDANPYQLGDLSVGQHRCPECANEMESPDAVVCLRCGYNTVTRERLALKKVHEITSNDRFMWLLPGIACAGFVGFLLLFDLLYCLLLRPARDSGWFISFLGAGAVKMWLCIFSAFAMFFLGRFAVSRLIYNPEPPEIERN
jgi:DNA-directed RNA polymerase subunit RPC12/RpoP